MTISLPVRLGCVFEMDLTISHVCISLCLRLMLDTGGVRFRHTERSDFAIPTPRSWSCTTAIPFASRAEYCSTVVVVAVVGWPYLQPSLQVYTNLQ